VGVKTTSKNTWGTILSYLVTYPRSVKNLLWTPTEAIFQKKRQVAKRVHFYLSSIQIFSSETCCDYARVFEVWKDFVENSENNRNIAKYLQHM